MPQFAKSAICAAVVAVTACTSTQGSASPSDAGTGRRSTVSPIAAGTSSNTRTPAPAAPQSTTRPATSPQVTGSLAQRALTRMSEAERVGQLIMVDCPSSGVAAATLTAIRSHHVGSVILDGNSRLGVTRTHAITAQLQRHAPHGVRLFVSSDQEGGEVQRMRGAGFSTIPSAVVQGTRSAAALRAEATVWGRQLRAAGINVDLAPVLDTVPSGNRSNPPIGDLDREYGRTPAAVTRHGVAVARGLADAGVDATAKHFPGLGRVSRNTDLASGVTDTRTTRHDAYLAPFAAAVKQHVPFVMMSTAIYSRIDKGRPAVFSRTIVDTMLRHDLGFTGVIISDDLGAAAQVRGYSAGTRAVDFVRAGGDIVLTVVPGVVGAMTSALLSRVRSDPAFKKTVDAAALTVLRAKQARGLLS